VLSACPCQVNLAPVVSHHVQAEARDGAGRLVDALGVEHRRLQRDEALRLKAIEVSREMLDRPRDWSGCRMCTAPAVRPIPAWWRAGSITGLCPAVRVGAHSARGMHGFDLTFCAQERLSGARAESR
jgi:hypothetical protein